jgi:glucosylglycerate hydrolase
VTSEAERDEGDGRHAAPTLPPGDHGTDDLAARCRAVLEAAWRTDGAAGFCVPNATTYPWQWLWDSCFHAVVWAHLGDERASLELQAALSAQDDDGFVPHLRYVHGPNPHAGFWARPATSSITQPPMYGHAAAVVGAAGLPLPDDVLDRAAAGLRFLLRRRQRSPGGLVELCHPWESGCDDSPRWDSVLDGAWDLDGWYERKGALVGTIERSATGAPVRNPAFRVGSAGFSALVAWNALELAPLVDGADLVRDATELREALDARWDAELVTWVDDGPTAAGSGRVRTLDALLPALVVRRPEALVQLTDRRALGAPFGPAGVHRAEPSFDPAGYWRGSAWPQLTYLSWRAARWAGEGEMAASFQKSMASAVVRSRFSEHWDPDSADPLGAAPQSWSALACVLSG